MNRPTPVKPDNFFLMIYRALSQRRVPLALRIACTNLFLVALALVIYACVMGLQFKQAMHEQADALGQSLTTQTATSATELLVSNDILSLNVLLGNLVKNPLVAHAAIYSVDNRILAEAGQRPRNSLLGEAEGLYQTKITFQDVTAGQLRISLDMSQFQQPMLISLQSMGILAAILLALALSLSLRQARHITTPLLQLRVWLRDPQPYTPATDRQDEIGDIARQLHTRLAPPPPPEPEPEEEDDEDDFDDLHDHAPAPKTAPRAKVVAQADEEDDDAFAGLLDNDESAPKPVPYDSDEPQNSAVLAVQLGSQEQLRRLPRTRLTELLERYRDCLEQAASLYDGETHTLNDGSTLVLFHSRDCGEDYLTNAICCGELLRALGHALQIEVADSGITLQLQLGLALGNDLQGLELVDLLMAEKAQDALALSQHSRNLLLVERQISDDALIRQRARIRPIASPEGACCVERLMEPYPSMLERQLARMHERRACHKGRAADTKKPASMRAFLYLAEPSEPIDFHIGTNRRSHRDLGLLGCLLDLYRCSGLFRRLFGNGWLIGQRLDRRAQLFGQLLQQLPLSLHLRRFAALMLLLEVNDAVVTHMATTVEQAPLGVQNRRLVLARVQAGNRQQHLHVRAETSGRRGQHHALAIQPPGQLANQQLVNVRREAAGPTTVGRRTQAAIGLTLQERLALQVIGNRYRAEHHGHARALRRLARITAVELVQGHRLMHAASAQPQKARHQQRKWKAQKFHHPIQAVATGRPQ